MNSNRGTAPDKPIKKYVFLVGDVVPFINSTIGSVQYALMNDSITHTDYHHFGCCVGMLLDPKTGDLNSTEYVVTSIKVVVHGSTIVLDESKNYYA